jgi:hypothetical protein
MPVSGDMPSQRRMCSLAGAQLFLGREGKTGQVAKRAKILATNPGGTELFLIELGSGE